MKIQPYPPEIETHMCNFYKSLSEKDRRRYAAIEVSKLEYGGIAYISDVLQCDKKTIKRGQSDLSTELSSEIKRIRQKGAGRKHVLATTTGLDDAFLDILKNKTAGSPMDETIKWTNLSRPSMAEQLKERGFKVSVTVVDNLLKKHGFRRRQAFKSEAGKKNIPQWDEQFKNIDDLKQQYLLKGNPELSMDVKKKS
jgi:hypothetical protein